MYTKFFYWRETGSIVRGLTYTWYIPHASAKTRSSGIICFNPRSFGLDTSSRSRKFAPLMRFDRNSSRAFRGEFGICHDASRIHTFSEDERSRSWEGVTNREAAELIALLWTWKALWISFGPLTTRSDCRIMFKTESKLGQLFRLYHYHNAFRPEYMAARCTSRRRLRRSTPRNNH